MNPIEIIREIDDNREAELIFENTVELSNGDKVNFDAYREIDGTAKYLHIEDNIYVIDYYECEDGVSAGLECIYGEVSSLHLDAISRKLDL